MKVAISLVLGCLLALVLPPAARAYEGRQYGGAGYWRAYSWVDDNTGNFSHCTMETHFTRTNDYIMILVAPGNVTMVISNIAWRLPVGNGFPANVSIGSHRWSGNAIAFTSSAIKMDFDNVIVDFLQAFIVGNVMNVVFDNGVNWTVSLKGTARVTDGILQCLTDYGVLGSTNPFGPGIEPPPVAPPPPEPARPLSKPSSRPAPGGPSI